MHAKEKHLHRLYGKEEIARDGASIYCFIILEVWQSLVYCAGLENRRSVNAGPGVRIRLEAQNIFENFLNKTLNFQISLLY